MRYEYYVHLFSEDRRFDRWVTEHYIRVDPDEIHRQDKELDTQRKKEDELKKLIACQERERRYLFNDENHGMSE